MQYNYLVTAWSAKDMMELAKLKNIEYYKFNDLKNKVFTRMYNQTITCQSAFWTIKVIMKKFVLEYMIV